MNGAPGDKMRWRNNVASHAALGFALVWGIAAASIFGSYLVARNAADALERTLIAYADDLAQAARAQMAAERMVAVGRGYLLTSEPDLLVRVREAEGQLDVALQSLDRGEAVPHEENLLGGVKRSAARYRQLLNDTFGPTPATEDRQALANALREKLQPAREDLADRLAELVAHRQVLQVAARREASRLASRSVRITLGLGSLALTLSTLLAWLFTRRLAEIYRRERTSAHQVTLALAAKEELLGIVAHDLRNPLSAILLRASSIEKSDRDQKTIRAAASIRATCQRMAFLTQSLLDAASVEAGRMSVVAGCVPVETVMADTLEVFSPVANEKRIRLEQDVTPNSLDVWADRERLLQVLSNLMGNALKFTPEGGTVRISAHSVMGRVKFEVRDSGPGIAPEHLPRLFEQYWKSDPQGRRGTGLGLYIAKGIVEAHHGHIWVDSTPGKGSSFQFELSLPPSRNERQQRPSDASSVPLQPIEHPLEGRHHADQ
jgi:signal transduction histidine kinase